jgi:hypothetical protein
MGATAYGWQTLSVPFDHGQLEHYMFMHMLIIAQKYSVGLQEFLSPGNCAPRKKILFSHPDQQTLIWISLRT